mmetsp:Transcript_76534/g.211408  ORF Transcript_76534/g.211408 Transcript_76534/m.211408 type:complete len:252 (+) Transcript_76534:510-1265(+)
MLRTGNVGVREWVIWNSSSSAPSSAGALSVTLCSVCARIGELPLAPTHRARRSSVSQVPMERRLEFTRRGLWFSRRGLISPGAPAEMVRPTWRKCSASFGPRDISEPMREQVDCTSEISLKLPHRPSSPISLEPKRYVEKEQQVGTMGAPPFPAAPAANAAELTQCSSSPPSGLSPISPRSCSTLSTVKSARAARSRRRLRNLPAPSRFRTETPSITTSQASEAFGWCNTWFPLPLSSSVQLPLRVTGTSC